MLISNINPLKNNLPLEQQNQNLNISELKNDKSFVNSLKELMADVNNVQKQSGDLTERFIKNANNLSEKPKPKAGGIPYSIASTKSSSNI